MIAHTSIGEVYYTFQHCQEPVMYTPWPGYKQVKGYTRCTMTMNGTTFAAYAYCAMSDTFNKETGRKVALKKVLEEAKLSRDDRRAVWLSYHDRSWPNIYQEATKVMQQLWDHSEAAY